MGQRISGPGVGLADPQWLYPTEINAAEVPQDLGQNWVTLAPGDAIAVPAGSWYVRCGRYSVVQYNDPVSNVWRHLDAEYQHLMYVNSDGFNYRLANMTGCPVAAVVTSGGSGFTSVPTITASTGTSTWLAVVGGALSVSTVSVAGKGYGIAPMVLIGAPPDQVSGVQATAYATMVGGSVSAVTLNNVGAGYVLPPTVQIVPSPFDPNVANGTAITTASVTLGVVSSGSITAVLCTNPGVSVSAAPTLTVAGGGGSGATVSAVWCNTLVSSTVSSSGAFSTSGAWLTSIGGGPSSVPWDTQPEISGLNYMTRPMSALLSGTSGTLSSISALYDGGLFYGTPTVVVAPAGGAAQSGTATITPTYGGTVDVVMIQPAP